MNTNDIVQELRIANDYPHSTRLFDRAADVIESLQDKLTELNDQVEWDNGLVKKLEAQLAASRRREQAAVEDLSGHCEYCMFRHDCAKHDNNDSGAGFTWWTDCEDWQWRGPQDAEEGEKE